MVRSEDGLDEVSPSAPTRVSEVSDDGEVRERVVAPEDFGIERVAREAIAGGDAQANARALLAILEGQAHPAADAVVLNAAAALSLASGEGLRPCAERARATIRSGAARETLERWKQAASRARAS
jgi:anthranilate phosphoribosyltransferase